MGFYRETVICFVFPVFTLYLYIVTYLRQGFVTFAKFLLTILILT